MKKQELQKLFHSMSKEEKIGQLFQITGAMLEGGGVITGPMQEMGITGEDVTLAGTVLGVMGWEKIVEIQKQYMEQHPHHIPLIFMLDIINGYKTIYPIPLAQGASFDPYLAGECAAMAAREGSTEGLHVTFSPMADLVRDARWGRVMESTGEDVYLNGLFAKAMVEGYQGASLTAPDTLGACIKHFAGYGAAEAGRDYNTVEISERTFRDFYLPAYQEALNAGCALAMTSFNTVNGIPATINQWLMRDILRKEMAFDGVLISDFGAIGETVNHATARDRKEAAQKALEAGCDIDMMSGVYPENIKKLLEEGVLKENLVEECAFRVLELKNKLGLFENPYKGAGKDNECLLSAQHRSLAKKMAEESFVLLENKEQILPLRPGSKVAFIGPYTNCKEILGGWSFTGDTKETVTIQEAGERLLDGYEVKYCQGCGRLSEDILLEGFIGYRQEVISMEEKKQMLEEARKAAAWADIIVMPLGEHFLQTGEAASKAILEIPEIQQKLLSEVSAINPNIAVVLFNGRPLDLREIKKISKGILEVWMPGTMGGEAIINTLTGKHSPCGKLPMSFPYCVGQIPVHYDAFSTGRPHDPEKNDNRYVSKYLDIPNAPLYPFGYGLSYTQFTISSITLDKNIMNKNDKLQASVKVKNIGAMEAVEVIQLYLRDVSASVARPVRQLKSIRRVLLTPGEEQNIVFDIEETMLQFTRQDDTKGSEPGKFELYIGDHSDTKNRTVFELL